VNLDDPLTVLKGVGPRRAADLERAGLRTVGDLLARFPIRYEDRTRFRDLATLVPGEQAAVLGTVAAVGLKLTRRPGFKLVEALVRTDTGVVRAVWLNQPFMLDVIRRGRRILLYGQVEQRAPAGLQLTNPEHEVLDDEGGEPVHTGRIVPVYEKAGTVTGRIQRSLVLEALQHLPGDLAETLPAWLIDECCLPDRRTALAEAHFPGPGTAPDLLAAYRSPAQVRLILDEFFQYQLGLLLRRRATRAERKPVVPRVDDRVRAAARAVLPFTLTAGQRAALKEIVVDMAAPCPMHRLLQGDVGAGKTVVALLAGVVAMENGLQVALMAPTEILAEQHAVTVGRLFARAPYRVALLTGSTPAADRRAIIEGLAAGTVHFLIGTHALVQEGVAFQRLGLVVVDEQHRFGVLQRAVLRRKGWNPDVLVMTATPIPRTLALTSYGDLDVSVIRDLPPGRTPVRTVARPHTERDRVYDFVRDQVAGGRQAYVVFPLIEESSKVDVRAATEMADHLAQAVLPTARLALLHGRLRAEAKERIMAAFVAGDVDVLVSTTVVEVGIDVPNATVMVVEHAERFGLAQLHQLRGRVGRGVHASTCVLLYQGPLGEAGEARLQALVNTTDGFVIAERDLELRGPGDVFGTRQSGAPTLRSGDLLRDRALMEDARRYAAAALERPGIDAIADNVARTWAERFGLADVG
jgi:ATP-dependent DNA helicase RecG